MRHYALRIVISQLSHGNVTICTSKLIYISLHIIASKQTFVHEVKTGWENSVHFTAHTWGYVYVVIKIQKNMILDSLLTWDMEPSLLHFLLPQFLFNIFHFQNGITPGLLLLLKVAYPSYFLSRNGYKFACKYICVEFLIFRFHKLFCFFQNSLVIDRIVQ